VAHRTLVKPGTKVRLDDHDPDYHGEGGKRDPEVRAKLDGDLEAMADLQERLYAEGKQALLIVLQGMDTSGKDGTVRHVMRGLNPQSCQVASFKVPTAEELAHDFLWRIHQHAPAKGQIAVFNRSHYEDVLAARVRGLVPEEVWRARYEHINSFERLLADSGTRIVKLFLHISCEEQKERLEQRLADPQKRWKFRAGDLDDRELWDEYVRAYEDALTHCSTAYAAWHIISANRKWYRNLVVADLIATTLRDMDPQWPNPDLDPATIKIP